MFSVRPQRVRGISFKKGGLKLLNCGTPSESVKFTRPHPFPSPNQVRENNALRQMPKRMRTLSCVNRWKEPGSVTLL